MANEATCHCGHKYANGYHQLTGACYPAGLFGVSRTVDVERQTGIRAVGAPSAEYAAECRGCEACPDGICSRHHPDDREASLGAHPEPAGMTALGAALTRSWAEHADHGPAESVRSLLGPAGYAKLAEVTAEVDRREMALVYARTSGDPASKACAHEMTALDTVEGGTFCLDCGGKPVACACASPVYTDRAGILHCTRCRLDIHENGSPVVIADKCARIEAEDRRLAAQAAPVDPYEAHAIRQLSEAADDFIVKLGEDEEPKTRAEALAQAEEALTEGRRVLAFATAGVARLERAIAEHGRKAGG